VRGRAGSVQANAESIISLFGSWLTICSTQTHICRK